MCLAAPPGQRPPGAVTSVRLSILRGGRGEQEEREPLQVSWEGQLCPSPPAAPAGPASCGLPGTSRPGRPARGLLHLDKVAASSQPEPQAPQREPSLSRLHGVGWALVGLSLCIEPWHCLGRLAGGGPVPGLVQRGQVRSLQCPLPPLERVPDHGWRPCRFHPPGAQGSGQAAARPPGRLAHSDTVETEGFFSVPPRHSWSGGERNARADRQLEERGGFPHPSQGQI